LVDDTVIFAGRLRQAKYNLFVQRKELGLLKSKEEFNEKDHVEVALIPGISHGFLQFVGVFPEGWKHIFRCARWMDEIFASHEDSSHDHPPHTRSSYFSTDHNGHAHKHVHRHHHRAHTESSGDEDRPLEMSSSVGGGKGRGKREGGSVRGRGRGRSPEMSRSRSTVSLASEDDLLGRRMKGLTGGLLGLGEGREGVDTP